jgi:hypothetical protein
MTEPRPEAVSPGPAESHENTTPTEATDAPRDEKSVGEGISAAAANPGTTAARGEQVRKARQSFAFDTVNEMRDAVAGNQYNIYAAVHEHAETGMHELRAEFVLACRRTLVQPGRRLAEHAPGGPRIEIFRGKSGCGKAALAVWSLAGPETPGPVFRVDPRTPVGGLTLDQKSAGYLLEDLPAASGSALTGFDLDRLAADLDRLDSRLVITVRSETTFTDHTVNGYVREISDPPAHRKVLEAHLGDLLGDEASVSGLLGRQDVAKLLDEELSPSAPLRKAAALARLIAAEASRPSSLVAKVRGLLRQSDEHEFTAWFDGLGDLHLQCFAISLAIFNGLPYETVSDAGLMLHRKFDVAGATAVATKAVPEAVNPFGDGRASRLQQLRARVGREMVRTTFWTVPAEVVTYADVSFPARVLRHVWREHDRARTGLVSWLYDLGGHPSLTVRVRAATAVGVLTSIAYDHMRTEVLSRWARSKQQVRREAAAIALAGPAEHTDEDLAGAARNLVTTWSLGTPEQRATAAHAYGRIGLNGLDTALSALEKLTENEDNFDVVEAVCQSLAELVATDTPEIQTRVFGLLRSWSKSRRRERRTIAGLAFLLIAADLVTELPVAKETATWPSLLWLAHQNAAHHEVLARLWAESLNAAGTAGLALTVLDGWAELVEENDTARGAFVALMISACLNDRTPIRLRKQAATWAKTDAGTKAPRTARDLLAALDLKGLHS